MNKIGKSGRHLGVELPSLINFWQNSALNKKFLSWKKKCEIIEGVMENIIWYPAISTKIIKFNILLLQCTHSVITVSKKV